MTTKRILSVFTLLVTLGIVAVGSSLLVSHSASADDTVRLTTDVRVRLVEDIDAGVECAPWGVVEPDLEILPYRQLIVTDHRGDIVGAMDLQYSETVEVNDRMYCAFRGEFDVPDSGYYTFTVDGKYRLTVNRDDLASSDWTHEVVIP